MRERKNPPIPTPPDYTIWFGECPSFTMEMLKQENAELTTHINELEKERVQLDDQILNLQNMCEDEIKKRCELVFQRNELSRENELLRQKLKIAIDGLFFIRGYRISKSVSIEISRIIDQIEEVK